MSKVLSSKKQVQSKSKIAFTPETVFGSVASQNTFPNFRSRSLPDTSFPFVRTLSIRMESTTPFNEEKVKDIHSRIEEALRRLRSTTNSDGHNLQVLEDGVRQILRYCGENPNRQGLSETPRRFLEALKFYTSGYIEDPAKILKTFEDGAEGYDEMVTELNIPVWSMCEHHLAPFFGLAHVAYIPNKKVVGLSKIPRLIEIFARRLQIQERLTGQVADALWKNLKPKGVGVVFDCRHTCIECRGVQKPGVRTITSALRGVFKTKPEVRSEFLAFVKR